MSGAFNGSGTFAIATSSKIVVVGTVTNGGVAAQAEATWSGGLNNYLDKSFSF